MAFWSPETARCDYPEDSDLVSPTFVGGTDTTSDAAGKTGASAANCRGSRRVAARMRALTDVVADATRGEGGRSWNDVDPAEVPAERITEGGAGGSGTGGGSRSRGGRARRLETKWVMCDNCQKWRKLAPGMGSEDLPEKWCVSGDEGWKGPCGSVRRLIPWGTGDDSAWG